MSKTKRVGKTLCAARGCTRGRSAGQIFCSTHWYQVPKELRERIWKLYRAEQGSDAHRSAVYQAIRGVNEKIRAAEPAGE